MGISAGEVATASDVRKLEMICENQTFTRVMSAGSGDVAYTGYGFTPKALIAHAYAPDAVGTICWGNYASTHSVIRYNTQTASFDLKVDFSSSLLIDLRDEGDTTGQYASVKSLDADGFTLTWTKGGSPTATAVLAIMAIGDGT